MQGRAERRESQAMTAGLNAVDRHDITHGTFMEVSDRASALAEEEMLDRGIGHEVKYAVRNEGKVSYAD